LANDASLLAGVSISRMGFEGIAHCYSTICEYQRHYSLYHRRVGKATGVERAQATSRHVCGALMLNTLSLSPTRKGETTKKRQVRLPDLLRWGIIMWGSER